MKPVIAAAQTALEVRAADEPRRAAGAHGARERVDAGAVEALRSRLAGPTAREHVVLDFLADDLREARAALAAVAAYVANVEAALSGPDPSQQQLLALALGGRPADRVDALGAAVASVRRRLAQVAARM